ncbi:hypothetical protein BJY27_005717 [Streptomyces rapamycinicus]|uniref:Uncharacterized protein n=2 Tax=Streptomyces rapamycinicus TaxID=1226757 RepID=A0A3L8RIW5_STRRN|nr:hypothetical protein [Streptomyces rapamycinicus]RLV79766.1 hypothetical protein D3C57_115315 [Streptomyces rapamycinicus NRRL 5491]
MTGPRARDDDLLEEARPGKTRPGKRRAPREKPRAA